ncbi:MAG TPA: hypothetical protein VEQ38_20310, partial [Verrucomicrobiae bacterium]|nr:hypothetical protein [Verrucomicrobiae bacterium]
MINYFTWRDACSSGIAQRSIDRLDLVKKGLRPGGSGRLPARSSHRPVRAFLMHTVPQIMGSLRDDRLSGPPAPTEA